MSEKIPREMDPNVNARRMQILPCRLDSVDDQWHMLAMCMSVTHWNGVRVVKSQADLRRYFEIIARCRPEVVVETGLQQGGSALFFMDVLAALEVQALYVGIDLDCAQMDARVRGYPYPHLILRRDCLATETVATVAAQLVGKERALLVLDSVHSEEHVVEELRLYAPLVPPGGYLVVEDTAHGGNPVLGSYGPSAREAVERVMAPGGNGARLGFYRARDVEMLCGPWTCAPGGWLRRGTATR